MSDYFFNLFDFCCFTLSREKQTPIKKVVSVYAFGGVDFVCGEFYRNLYGSNIARQPVVAFGVNNRRNPRSNAYARFEPFLLEKHKKGGHFDRPKFVCMEFYTMP